MLRSRLSAPSCRSTCWLSERRTPSLQPDSLFLKSLLNLNTKEDPCEERTCRISVYFILFYFFKGRNESDANKKKAETLLSSQYNLKPVVTISMHGSLHLTQNELALLITASNDIQSSGAFKKNKTNQLSFDWHCQIGIYLKSISSHKCKMYTQVFLILRPSK